MFHVKQCHYAIQSYYFAIVILTIVSRETMEFVTYARKYKICRSSALNTYLPINKNLRYGSSVFEINFCVGTTVPRIEDGVWPSLYS